MRAATVILSFVLSCICANAQEQHREVPKFTFGAEWGYVATVIYGYHTNFFSPEGYRVDYRDITASLHNNAEVYFHAGYNLSPEWNISAYLGYAGFSDVQTIVPFSIRGTRFFGANHMDDRWFCFADLGTGICIKKNPQETLCGKLGGGYRLSLSRLTKLDFVASVRMTYAHIDINYKGYEIVPNQINRNNAYTAAVSFGLSITF